MSDPVLAGLVALRRELFAEGRAGTERLADVDPSHAVSARNLLHFLALRRHDLRGLQPELTRRGLSSLGRSEAHVFASVDAACRSAARLAGEPEPEGEPAGPVPTFESGPDLLASRTADLLGPAPGERSTRIMVTMPSEAADDGDLIARFIDEGMDCARINCAHDHPDAWRAMAAHVRAAATAAGRPVRIMMDLAGPKVRTGELQPHAGVVKVRPRRDAYGNVIEPAAVRLSRAPVVDGSIPIDLTDSSSIRPGTTLRLVDARGSKRRLGITSEDLDGWTAETDRTTYLVEGTELRTAGHPIALVGRLPRRPASIRIAAGDTLVLTDDPSPAPPSVPPRIGCTLPAVLSHLTVGQQVWFDDGKFGTVVEEVSDHEARLRVIQAPPGGGVLRPEKGINLPGTELRVAALSDRDRDDLAVVADIADCVALSFVQRGDDVLELLDELQRLDAEHLGVIVKIESQVAFERLPDIVLTLMRHRLIGLMIARGDLAVELGFEHLAEVQEEIMWLCEAAHLPAVWATQVLERLAKTGTPSRAEITDAAMADRAECVMLNKGPFVDDAISLLDGIFRRMQTHHSKKRALLGRLRPWT